MVSSAVLQTKSRTIFFEALTGVRIASGGNIKGNRTTPSFIYLNSRTLEIDSVSGGGCPEASILFFTILCLPSRPGSFTRFSEMTQMHIIHNVLPCCLSPLKQLKMFSRGICAGRAEVDLEVDELPEEETPNEDKEVSAECQRLAVHVCMDV